MDWSLYKNFSRDELACKHTNDCVMRDEMMIILQDVRDEYRLPIFISSGYRSPLHPIESMKDKPGEHVRGLAVDIICHGQKAVRLTELFFKHGVRRFGFHQKGNANARYIHVGIADKFFSQYQQTIWTY